MAALSTAHLLQLQANLCISHKELLITPFSAKTPFSFYWGLCCYGTRVDNYRDGLVVLLSTVGRSWIDCAVIEPSELV